jgi:hypothetical protein
MVKFEIYALMSLEAVGLAGCSFFSKVEVLVLLVERSM